MKCSNAQSVIQTVSAHNNLVYLQVDVFPLAPQLKQKYTHAFPSCCTPSTSPLLSLVFPSPPPALHPPVTQTLSPPPACVSYALTILPSLCVSLLFVGAFAHVLSVRLGNALQVTFREIDLPLMLPLSVQTRLHHHHHSHPLLLSLSTRPLHLYPFSRVHIYRLKRHRKLKWLVFWTG